MSENLEGNEEGMALEEIFTGLDSGEDMTVMNTLQRMGKENVQPNYQVYVKLLSIAENQAEHLFSDDSNYNPVILNLALERMLDHAKLVADNNHAPETRELVEFLGHLGENHDQLTDAIKHTALELSVKLNTKLLDRIPVERRMASRY